jgi:hypothetical protein
MNPDAIDRSATPWYREPWPWILMAGPAIAVVAGLATMYIAFTHADPLVADQYYKEGLAINRVMDRDHEAQARGYRATVLVNEERTLVRVQMAGEDLPAELRLHFIHLTRSESDRTFSAVRLQSGLYQGKIRLPDAVRWNVELEDTARNWRLTGVWSAADETFALKARE